MDAQRFAWGVCGWHCSLGAYPDADDETHGSRQHTVNWQRDKSCRESSTGDQRTSLATIADSRNVLASLERCVVRRAKARRKQDSGNGAQEESESENYSQSDAIGHTDSDTTNRPTDYVLHTFRPLQKN